MCSLNIMKTIKAEVIFKTSSFFNLVNSDALLEIKSILNTAFLYLIVSESHYLTLVMLRLLVSSP